MLSHFVGGPGPADGLIDYCREPFIKASAFTMQKFGFHTFVECVK